MKHFFKSLKKLRKISLTENEKLYGKESLLHFMEKNPVRDSEHTRRQLLKRERLFNGLQLIPQTRPMAIVVAIALIFSLGGGASVAANDALPGEALYPVKVNVNERVEGFMAFNEEAKAEFDLEKVETRLTEAEKLAEKNEADDEKITKVETRLEGHIERLEERAAKFEERGNEAKAEELRARLEAMLEVHTQVLTSLQSYIEQLNRDLGPDAEIEGEVEIKGNGNGLGRLIASIRLKAEATDDDEDDENEEQEEGEEEEEEDEEDDEDKDDEDEENEDGEDEDGEDEGPSREAALNARALVEKRMGMTLRFAERMGAKVGAEITEDAQAHLDNAEELYTDGEAQIEAESYSEAFASFRAAHKEIQRAHSQITSGIGLGNRFKADDEDEQEDENENEEEDDEDEDEEEDEQENSQDNTANTEASVQTEVNSPFARAWTSAKAKIGF